MYKVSVPVINGIVKRSNRDRLLTEIKRFNAERVFLALDTYELDENKRAEVMRELKDNCEFFKKKFDVFLMNTPKNPFIFTQQSSIS